MKRISWLFMLLLWAHLLPAQTINHFPPGTVDFQKGFKLSFELLDYSGTPLEITFFYRNPDSEEYSRLDVTARFLDGQVTVDSRELELSGGAFDYYLSVRLADGRELFLPPRTAGGIMPFHLVESPEAAARSEEPLFQLLSPLDYSSADQLVVAVALRGDISAAEIRVFLGGREITSACEIDPYLLTWVPRSGDNPVGKLLIQRVVDGNVVFSQELGRVRRQGRQLPARNFRVNTFEVVHFDQTAGDWQRNYHRLGGTLNWEQGNQRLKVAVNLALRDFHQPRLYQDQSRFQLKYELPWFQVVLGDGYPGFNELIFQGTRVRGATGLLSLPGFGLGFSAGLIRQRTEPANFPTLRRNLGAARILVGSTRSLAWTFSAMKAWDEDLPGAWVEDSTRNQVTPQENLVVGTGLDWRLAGGRFHWRSEAAFSVNNTNTSVPPFSNEAAEDWNWPSWAPKPETLEPLVTVNEYFAPMNFKGLTSLALQSRISTLVRNHQVSLQWQRIGNAYVSFAAPSQVRDLQTLRFQDAFRLLDNRLYFHLGGTFRRDNLSGSLDDTYGTTRNNTFLGQVAWFPLENLPRADLAVQYETRKNPGAVVNDSLDYRTDLHGLNLNLRLSWEFDIRQRANRLSLDFSNYRMQDLVEGPLHSKQSSQSGFFQLGIRSQLNDRLVNQGFLFWNRSTFTGSDPSNQLGLRNQVRYQWPRGNLSSQGEITFSRVHSETENYQRLQWGLQQRWRWRERYTFSLNWQQSYNLGAESATDSRFYLRLEQALWP